MVIWGTLLQRRVPPQMLGRVSSLDFFVSLVFMPVSMAMAGPLSKVISMQTIFLIAASGPVLLGLVAYLAARMSRDEIDASARRPVIRGTANLRHRTTAATPAPSISPHQKWVSMGASTPPVTRRSRRTPRRAGSPRNRASDCPTPGWR